MQMQLVAKKKSKFDHEKYESEEMGKYEVDTK